MTRTKILPGFISRSALVATAALAAPAILMLPARAQDAVADGAAPDAVLNEVTVSASLSQTGATRTGADVSVVTAKDLAASGDSSVADYLSRLPGISLSRNGGAGTRTSLRIRGLGPAYIGVRIDGIDVTDTSGTQVGLDFGTLTTSGLSRVEVLRGSQSALYGSESIGGVVDITTFRPSRQGVSGEAALEAGSDSTYTGALSFGLLTGRTEIAATLARTTTRGISAAASGTERDGFGSTSASLYAAYRLTDDVKIGFNGFVRDSRSHTDGTAYDPLTGLYVLQDTADTQTTKQRGGRIFTGFTLGDVESTLAWAWSRTERDYPLGYVRTYEGERRALSYLGTWNASGNFVLNFGADRTDEDFTAGTDKGDTGNRAIYAEGLWAATPDLDLSLALRRDDNDDFGGRTSGRVAVAWRAQEDIIVRAVAGTGFRAPSLYELNSPYGHKDLKPETSRSYELGVEKLFANSGSVRATLFRTTIRDRISYDYFSMACSSAVATGYAGCYDQVKGNTRTRGIELAAEYPVAGTWKAFGNYTYTDAKSDSDDGYLGLVQVPRHDLVIGAEGQIADRLTARAEVHYIGDYFNGSSVLPPATASSWTLVNAQLTWAVRDDTDAYLRVENLFDRDYQTVEDYGQPGRQFFAGLRARF